MVYKVEIGYEEDDPGGGYLIDFIVDEDVDPMSYKGEIK